MAVHKFIIGLFIDIWFTKVYPTILANSLDASVKRLLNSTLKYSRNRT